MTPQEIENQMARSVIAHVNGLVRAQVFEGHLNLGDFKAQHLAVLLQALKFEAVYQGLLIKRLLAEAFQDDEN